MFILFGVVCGAGAEDLSLPLEPTLELPAVGASQLRILSPNILELTLVTTKPLDPAPAERWNFVSTNGALRSPRPNQFSIRAAGEEIPVRKVGFRRRVLYAPLKERDLRIGNQIYLELARPIGDNKEVEAKNPDGSVWPAYCRFIATSDPLRWSPVIHVNQVGYLPEFPKKAMVGYYLGSLGELQVGKLMPGRNERTLSAQPSSPSPQGEKEKSQSPIEFFLLAASTGKPVFQGRLTSRPDQGFSFSCYQQVLEADFSEFKTPGEYRLQVPGLGVSYRFLIDEGSAAAFARTYALGLYHQRCGTNNVLPFTRFTHDPCHIAPAEIPLPETNFAVTWSVLAQKNAGEHQTAPQLTNNTSSLFPFIKRGKIDVSGGHHDAGDYSKYTINCAGLIHHLVFAADVLSGVGDFDNLGLPESGDGKSDLLQEAKWEADFLAKMQDDDGGFYFLVYPREREYESDVTSDRGDPQIVWPKNTAATAAAVAALAQCSSSPRLRKQFPAATKLYLEKARKGWGFLEKALAKHGKKGAYQKITHYGDEFAHDDELAWAACEMFLATGDQAIHRTLLQWLNPADPNTRKWSWWRLYDAYGCAIRSYAFAVQAGKIKSNQLDLGLLSKCETEIIAAAEDQLRRAQESAYGTSFPSETKRVRAAGWYFSCDAAFDLAVASQLDFPPLNDPRPKFLEAVLSNLNYEAGCNPVNVTYVTGLGWKRQRVIVHQNAFNFRQALPPTGIPIGNLQSGFGWLDHYKHELGALTFPPDGRQEDPYPIYDRWGDSWNVNTEFVVLNQARALAATAWLMAKTSLKTQPWKCAPGRIPGLPTETEPRKQITVAMEAKGLDLSQARTVWEGQDLQPVFGAKATINPSASTNWVEAEAQLPDGRRAFGVTNFSVRQVGR